MVEFFLTLAEYLDEILWGPWTMIFIAGVSVYLTARSGLFQIRGVAFILRNTFGRLLEKRTGEASEHRMTPFQATSTALASTVGTGNIPASRRHSRLEVRAPSSGCGSSRFLE